MPRPMCPQCDADPSDAAIGMHSGVNNDHRGFVHLSWGQQRAQMNPDELRTFALELLTCAEAAESDSMVLRLLVDKVGLDRTKAVQVISDLRNFRDSNYKKKES